MVVIYHKKRKYCIPAADVSCLASVGQSVSGEQDRTQQPEGRCGGWLHQLSEGQVAGYCAEREVGQDLS